jgi:hypothetical protein
MPWVLIPIIAIIAWAVVESAKYRSRAGLSGEAEAVLRALGDQLDEARAEQARLTQRVENLEAIVTSEPFELEREARRALPRPGQALPEGGGVPPLALEEPETAEDDAAQAARLARRIRGG